MIRYGSVCSGIEAATVAWHPLGWEAAWFAEIESFPSAVLAHHYPNVPNLGDMTAIAARVAAGEIEAPDILVGGTPCQAFSVAGLRGGLSDARGQLTLSYVELANEIDAARSVRGERPAVIVWENVPGVLSSRDNAFGYFLAGLAGESCELKPPGRKWPNAGCVLGPQRAIAWRVLDAQYFGVAQRRRRVFVVASARDGFDPAAVLFEFQGVRRDHPPRRETGQNTAAGTLRSTDGGSDVDHAMAGHLVAGGVVSSLDASYGRLQGCSGQDMNHGHSHLVPVAGGVTEFLPQSSRVYMPEGVSPALQAAGHANAGGQVAIAFNARQDPDSWREHTGPLDTDGSTQAVCIHADAIGRTGEAVTPSADAEGKVRLRNPGLGVIDDGTSYNLMATGHPHAVCVTGDVAHTLRAEGFDASEDGTGRGHPIIAQTLYNKGFEKQPRKGIACTQEADSAEILRTLREKVGAEAFAQWGLGILNSLQSPEVLRSALHGVGIRRAARKAGLVVDDCALPCPENMPTWALLKLWEDGPDGCSPQGLRLAQQLAIEFGKALPILPSEGSQRCKMAVRRLLPIEEERLQGFPDGYTRIQVRKFAKKRVTKTRPEDYWELIDGAWWLMSADGPRYKALGNSMAVPCMHWIGRRIDAAIRSAA